MPGFPNLALRRPCRGPSPLPRPPELLPPPPGAGLAKIWGPTQNTPHFKVFWLFACFFFFFGFFFFFFFFLIFQGLFPTVTWFFSSIYLGCTHSIHGFSLTSGQML
ncbi:unnamed protein product [Coccothraustes coccothraustes]